MLHYYQANVELLKCLNDISISNVKTMISNAFHESYNLMGNKCILSNKDRLQLLIKYAQKLGDSFYMWGHSLRE